MLTHRRRFGLAIVSWRAKGYRRLVTRLGPLLRHPLLREAFFSPGQPLANNPGIRRLIRPFAARAARRRRAAMVARGTPKISVIMAACNASATIREAIASVCDQTYGNFELVIVDDASDDDTAGIVNQVAASEPRIRFIGGHQRRGAAGARNQGLSVASGDYFTFHDADDRSHPRRLERQLWALLRQPSAVFCVCNSMREDDRRTPLPINGRWIANAPITMMVRTHVRSDIGYLMNLRESDDSEYYERIKVVFGRAAEVRLLRPLYFQRFAPTSLLFSDGYVSMGDRGVTHRRSQEADAALAWFRTLHAEIASGNRNPYIGVAGARDRSGGAE